MSHSRRSRLGKPFAVVGLAWLGAAGCGTPGGTSDGGAGGASHDAETGATCRSRDFSIEASLSTAISTVGIVTWSFAGTMTEAHIDFGRTASSWEYRAPVADPEADAHRTLLLGMKERTTYSYQIEVKSGGRTCTSDVQTITTGAKRNGLPTIQVDTPRPDELYAGFTIGCQYASAEMAGTAYILDNDGDMVWWFRGAATDDCSAAEMSYDGQDLFISAVNVDTAGGGKFARVSMDGSSEKKYDLPDLHHHFCLGPDGKIAYIEYARDGCDDIKELDPETGATRLIYAIANASPSQDASTDCHSNAVNWWPDQNLYTVSVLNWNAVVAFSRAGQRAWLLGGTSPTISGASWNRQHNHHLTSENSLLLFNNEGSDGSSFAREYRWTGESASEIWTYSAGMESGNLGDVKRLPNGNTLVTFSNNGTIHEVNASGQLVRSIMTQPLGYTVRRSTLYGPPPPWAW